MPPTDNCCYHSRYQISQSCSTDHQNTSLERLLPRPNSSGVPDKVTLTLSCLGGHLQIHGDTEPSPVVLGEQATMEKTTQRFQKIATTLADLNAEGLNVQTVNDLLTMYVGAASQHVLRVSFVPEQEAQNFDRQVLTFWSRLMHRDITSQLFFLPLKLGGFWSGFCCSTTCGCSMACVAVGHPFIDDYNPISGHRFTFSVQHHYYVPNSPNFNPPSRNK